MKVGLLIIASEVLNGKIKDLNTHFLADYLRQNNLELELQLTVRDEMSSIHQGLDLLCTRCDVIITSGGVGPTKDDLTKDALGSYLGRKNVYSAESERVATENYARMGRPFPGKEHVYSFMPEGFTPLSNPTGFAPGFFTEEKGKLFFSAPGVPRELRCMINEHFPKLIFPRIKHKEFIDLLVVRTRKVPEEKIFNEVDPDLWQKLETFGEVSSLPVIYGVDIGVKIKAPSETELKQKQEKCLEVFKHSPVWQSVWHIGNEPLEEIILQKAMDKELRFGFAESATGGLCSERITSVSGMSKCFFGSVVCYDNSIKTTVLKVKQETIDKYTVYSVETAREMAQGLCELMNLDIGVSITGIAGPNGGTPENPVGTVCIGVSCRGKNTAERYEFKGDRELLKNRFSQVALMMLLESLEKIA
jgi:nicotinamide-nucleotide amidase